MGMNQTGEIQITSADNLKYSPRQFLRIGKVKKDLEEPLTEAQVKHRDRSYIISKLNKSIQRMQGDEKKKKLGRSEYLNSYKEATVSEVVKQPDFQEKADNRSPKKKKGKKG